MTHLFDRSGARCALLAALLADAGLAAYAQAPTLTGRSPVRNAKAAVRATNVALTFNQAISAATVGNVRVFSAQRGGQRVRAGQGAVSGGGTTTITFNPTLDFQPGELVFVTVPPTVVGTNSQAAARHVYQFTTAAGGTGRASFGGGSEPDGGRKPATVAVADVDHDGDLDLLSANAEASSVSIRLNDGTGAFTGTQDVSVGNIPQGITVADVDDDGDLDFFTANTGVDQVSVRLNDGLGNFSGTQEVAVGDDPQGVAVGDVDGDGDLDLLTANTAGSDVSVRLNDGMGNFSGTQNVAVGTGPWYMTVGDVDADGDLDLLTANWSSNLGNTVSVRLNDGAGTFAGGSETAVGSVPRDVAVGDVDGDGDLDLVTANSGSNDASIRLNNGAGLFAGTQDVAVGTNPQSVRLADLDADGDLDLLTGNQSGSVSVRLNPGSGTFGGGSEVAVPHGVLGIAVGDVDGDLDLDLLAGSDSFFGTAVSVRLNGPGPTATFELTATTPARNAVAAPRTGDLVLTFNQNLNAATGGNVRAYSSQRAGQLVRNGNAVTTANTLTIDPANDLKPGETIFVTVPATVRSATNVAATPVVYQFTAAVGGSGQGRFLPAPTPTVSVATPVGVATADADGDGDLDLLVANNTGSAQVFRNDGTGAFGAPGSVGIFGIALDINGADSNGDGAMDIQTTSSNVHRTSYRVNNGSGSFSGTGNADIGVTSARRALSADLDGDGTLNPVAANPNENTFTLRPANNALSSYSTGVGTTPLSAAVGDVDGDGDLDVVTANSGNGTISICRNTGSAVYGAPTTVSVGSSPQRVVLADVNGDGFLDALTANSGSNSVSVLLNDGSGTFAAQPAVAVGTAPVDLVVADVDADGDLDLATVNNGSQSVSVRFNDGLGSFSAAAGFPDAAVGVNPQQLTAADLDGDLDLDLLVSNRGSNTVSVLLNQPSDVDLTISSPSLVPGGTYHNVTVTNGGAATLDNAITITGALVVQAGGALFDNCAVVSGAGTFTLAAGATLSVCNPQGISANGATGAVQVTGARAYAADATYRYVGAQAQQTGTGLTGARELEINNAAGVSLSQPTTVTQVLRLTSGTLTTNNQLSLRSTATATAYAVHAGGLTSGSVKVQRYVGGPATVSYHHLAAPVSGSTVADLTTAGYSPKVNPAYNAIPHPSLGLQVPTVTGFDETRGGTVPANQAFINGYYSPTALTDALTNGRGWSLSIPGGTTPDFIGTLVSGDVAMPLTVTGPVSLTGATKGGWHLLGNPYAQPLDWDLATIPAGLEAAVYVWYSTGGANGAYRARVAGAGNLTDGLIGVGQGLWVVATAPTTFTFRNAMRVEDNVALGRPATDARPRLTLTLTDAQGQADEATVYAQPGATAAFDGAFDALRPGRNVGVPTLSALIGGQEALVSGLAPADLTGGTPVELTAVLPAAGTYAIGVGALTNLSEATLLDRLTNTRYDLSTAPTVTFAVAQAGEVAGRFALVFGQRALGNSSFLLSQSSFAVWPNPATGTVQVRGAGLTGAPVELLDAAGRVVRTTHLTSGTTNLSLTGLPSGVYVVRCGAQTRRLVVE